MSPIHASNRYHQKHSVSQQGSPVWASKTQTEFTTSLDQAEGMALGVAPSALTKIRHCPYEHPVVVRAKYL